MSFHRHLTHGVLALTLVAPLACDDDDGNDVDMREAEIGWTKMNREVQRGHQDFVASVALSTDGEITLACDDGGSLRLAGRINDERDDFQLDAVFDGCTDDGTTIDGDLRLVARVDVDVDIDDDDDDPDHAEAAVVVDYTGALTFTGDVEGTCSIDASVRAGAVVFDGFAAAGVTVEGHICEHDADDVLDGRDDDDHESGDDDGL